MTNITDDIHDLHNHCEEINKKQIKIYKDQLDFVDQKICKKCQKDYWETIDLYLKGYYYEHIHEIDIENNEKVLRFDLILMMEDIKCKKCYDQWDKYVGMEDQRFRLDLKKSRCYDKLFTYEQNQKRLHKFI